MSRLLAELSTIEAFKETGFSLTDWIALSVLARGSVNNNNRLAKVLGVSRQRANQIKTSLEEIQLISSAQSSEDARENVLVVTDAGRTRLAEIDAKILAIMSTLKDEELVGRANRSVRLLRRAIRATTVQAVKSAGPGELDDERRE